MRLNDLSASVRAICGLGTEYEPDAVSYINTSRFELASRIGLVLDDARTATIPASPATGDYDLPVDLNITGLDDLAYATFAGARLEPVTLAEILDRRRFPNTSQAPLGYYLHGDKLLLDQVPAAGAEIVFYGTFTPAPLSGPADAPTELPEAFHAGLIDGACRFATMFEKPDRRPLFDAAWEVCVGNVRRWQTERRSTSPVRVRTTTDY